MTYITIWDNLLLFFGGMGARGSVFAINEECRQQSMLCFKKKSQCSNQAAQSTPNSCFKDGDEPIIGRWAMLKNYIS
jgi:hypothetical protein